MYMNLEEAKQVISDLGGTVKKGVGGQYGIAYILEYPDGSISIFDIDNDGLVYEAFAIYMTIWNAKIFDNILVYELMQAYLDHDIE